MNTLLGNLGSLYMLILILLLIVGLGAAVMGFGKYILKDNTAKNGNLKNNKIINRNGGFTMQSNGWLKLALFSLVGIIVSFVLLTFINPNGTNNMAAHQGMQTTNQTGMPVYGNPMGNAYVQTPYSNMQTHSNVNMGMSGQTQMNNQMGDIQGIMHRMDQMQMQMNQMQQQMGMMQPMPQGQMPMPQGQMPMQQMQPQSSSMSGSGGGMGMGMMGGMM